MTIEINLEKLRRRLILIYSYYLADDNKLREKAEKMAMDLDGLWSGSFLLPKTIEKAIGGLTYIYVEPRLSKEKAKKILRDLKNEGS